MLAGLGVGASSDRTAAGAPFINPIFVANALCGGDAASLDKRRAFFVRIAAAYAEETAPEAPANLGVAEKIGDIAYKITAASGAAQAHFNIGLAHTWNFNHGEAIRHFQAAHAEDPNCAEQLFVETLAEAPNNGWVLYGLAETYRAEGDKNGAKFAANLFRKAWAGDPKSLSLALL